MSEDKANRLTEDVNRRTFLRGLAATGAAAGLGVSTMTGTAAAASSSRRSSAKINRNYATSFFVKGYNNPFSQITNSSNNDEQVTTPIGGTDYHTGIYRKALPLTTNEYAVSPSDYTALKDVVENDSSPATIPVAGGRSHVEPHAANHFNSEGLDPQMAIMPEPPGIESSETAASILDVYYMALYRDVPLPQIGAHDFNWFNSYQSEMGSYTSNNPWIDTSNVVHWFRGVFEGTRTGPFISQFYLHDVSFGGGLTFSPQVTPLLQNTDYAYNETDNGPTDPSFTAMREGDYGGAEPGGNHSKPTVTRGSDRWITTGRDLASLVRDEPSYHHYYMAALQLCRWGASFSETVPNATPLNADMDSTALRYINYGKVGVLDLLARVARNALNAAWYHKWRVHMRMRPEAAGGNAEYGDWVHQDVLDSKNSTSNVIGRFQNMNGYAFLPLAYPEGAPTHPAYPSGHSAIAGACVTVLKCLFDDDTFANLDNFTQLTQLYRSPDTVGGSRQSPFSATPSDLTVHGELNKLADNIGTARMWAGVHYWRDHVWGARLGEQIAIATLMQATNDTSNWTGSTIDGSQAPLHAFEFTPLKQGAGSMKTTQSDLETLRQNSQSRPW